MKIDYDAILSKFPPSYINNSRKYVRQLLENYEKDPSPTLAHDIKTITGVDLSEPLEDAPF